MGLGVPIPPSRRYSDTVLAGQTKDIKLGDFSVLKYGELLAHFEVAGVGKKTDKITIGETLTDVEDTVTHKLGNQLNISTKVKKVLTEIFLEVSNAEAGTVSVFLTLTT